MYNLNSFAVVKEFHRHGGSGMNETAEMCDWNGTEFMIAATEFHANGIKNVSITEN